MKQSKVLRSHNKTHQISHKIIGVILILSGIIFIYTTFSVHLKLSASLILIGFVIVLMTTKEDTAKTINNIQLILIIILLTLVVWLVTINVDFDIFIILMIISIIALKEMLEKFLSLRLQKRMNILFYLLFIPLVIIFVQRIINILSMYPS